MVMKSKAIFSELSIVIIMRGLAGITIDPDAGFLLPLDHDPSPA
jgi:hypothetical protein